MTQIKPIDPKQLYLITTFTDDAAGTLIYFLPVDDQANPVNWRTAFWRGQCVINNQTVTFPIPATSLEEAVKNFVPAVEACIENLRSNMLKQALLSPTGSAP